MAQFSMEIMRLTGSVPRGNQQCSSLGPSAGDLVLLPDTGLILKPNLYAFSSGRSGGNLCHCGGETFLKSSMA